MLREDRVQITPTWPFASAGAGRVDQRRSATSKRRNYTVIHHLGVSAFVFLALFHLGCSKRGNVIKIVPGQSIGAISLEMSKLDVVQLLGKPPRIYTREEMNTTGQINDVTPDGRYIPAQMTENLELLLYDRPPVGVLINTDDGKVKRIGLYYCDDIIVQDYPFLKFKYLTSEELDGLGTPSSKCRMKNAEEVMMSHAPKGTVWEYYEYHYDSKGLNLGLVIDKTKQDTSKHYIGINHIDVYPPK
jgi:hypothetical protein